MKTKDITPSEYAQIKEITLQAVTKMIRSKGALPDVIKIKKFSRFYVLEVLETFGKPHGATLKP